MTEHDFYISIQIAITAWTIRNILMRPGMMLNGYFLWLSGLAATGREWLAKPLGYCDQCLAGQLALWAYFLRYPTKYSMDLVPDHVAFIAITVFITYQLQRLDLHEN